MSDTCTIEDATIVRDTEKAILVEADELDEEVWIPKSVVHDDSEVYLDQHGEGERGPGKLVVKGWWGEQNHAWPLD